MSKNPMMTPRQRKEVDQSTFAGRFAVKLKAVREKKKMTIEELSEKTGIPQTTLYRWESTDRCPVNEQIVEVAKALGVKISSLIPEE